MDGTETASIAIVTASVVGIVGHRLLNRARQRMREAAPAPEVVRSASMEARGQQLFTELRDSIPVAQPPTSLNQALELLKELKSMLTGGDAASLDRLSRAISLLNEMSRHSSLSSGEQTPSRLRDAAVAMMLQGAKSSMALGVRQWMPEEFVEIELSEEAAPEPTRYKTVARQAPLKDRVVHPKVRVRGFEVELLSTLEDGVCEWEFDSVRLSTLTGGHALLALCWALCERHGLREKLGFKSEQVLDFCSALEESYLGVPYHNSEHATDVLHAMHWLLTETQAFGSCAPEPLDVFIAIVAAAGHDANHNGRNNAFHCKTDSVQATTHAYQAPLERHHLATTFRLLEKTKLLAVLPEGERLRVRERLLALILATDFGEHKPLCDSFKNMLAHQQQPEGTADAGADAGAEGTGPADMGPEQRLLCLKMAIKLADLSYLSKGAAYAALWTERVLEEFFEQGDDEKARGLPISNGFDRTTHAAGAARLSSQLGFIGFMVRPLYAVVGQLVPEVAAAPMTNLQALYDGYEAQRVALEGAG